MYCIYIYILSRSSSLSLVVSCNDDNHDNNNDNMITIKTHPFNSRFIICFLFHPSVSRSMAKSLFPIPGAPRLKKAQLRNASMRSWCFNSSRPYDVCFVKFWDSHFWRPISLSQKKQMTIVTPSSRINPTNWKIENLPPKKKVTKSQNVQLPWKTWLWNHFQCITWGSKKRVELWLVGMRFWWVCGSAFWRIISSVARKPDFKDVKLWNS